MDNQNTDECQTFTELGSSLLAERAGERMHTVQASTAEVPQSGRTGRSTAPVRRTLEATGDTLDTRSRSLHVDSGRERRGSDVEHLRFKAKLAGQSKKILVVDDDSDHLSTVGEVLGEEGYLVETAHSGGEALELLTMHRPDLILLDLMMPEMDGWTLYAEIRKRRALTRVPVVMMTHGGERVLAQAPVASGYLAKPLHRRELLETVEACLIRHRI